MEPIKDLYKGINLITIPKVILKELRKNSNQRSFTSVRGKDGKMVTTYGDFINPIFMYFSEYNFYLNMIYFDSFCQKIDLGIVYDYELNEITLNKMEPFYLEYSKGFHKGYNEFESNLKNENSLFLVTNEQISYNIFSKIITDNKGYFPTHLTAEFQRTDLEKQILKEKNLKFLFKIKKESFFESGFNGGEFYKAWEIILKNPTIFEPIFNKAYHENKTITTEPEAIDLSNTTATEKIIYLHKLGVIDFLRTKQPFTSSINSLATILSAVTGEKSGTIQPMLNAMLSKNVNDKNNPLNSQKPTNKVTQQLNQIGFNSNETI